MSSLALSQKDIGSIPVRAKIRFIFHTAWKKCLRILFKLFEIPGKNGIAGLMNELTGKC